MIKTQTFNALQGVTIEQKNNLTAPDTAKLADDTGSEKKRTRPAIPFPSTYGNLNS